MDDLILVDIFDNEIGRASKVECHKKPMLHRAFSVFLYNKGKLLLQQRAKSKYHSAGLWANSCCSHPRTNNTISDAKIRLVEEIGVKNVDLTEIYSFVYFSKYADNLFEYELDHVFIGNYAGDFIENLEEVEKLEWVDYNILENDLVKNPTKYATWFLNCAPKVISYLKEKNL